MYSLCSEDPKLRLKSWWLRNSWKKWRNSDLQTCCGSLHVLSWGCCMRTAADKPQDHGWNQGEKELALSSPTYLGSAIANGTVAGLIWTSPSWTCFFNYEHLKRRNKLSSQLKCPGSRFPVCQTAPADKDFLFKIILEQLHLKCQSKPPERGQVCKKIGTRVLSVLRIQLSRSTIIHHVRSHS